MPTADGSNILEVRLSYLSNSVFQVKGYKTMHCDLITTKALYAWFGSPEMQD